jgi:hypothetical protein
MGHPWNTRTAAAALALFVAAAPVTARAGMPTLTLTDVAEMRVQTISFFAVVFLLSAAGVKALWNYLARNFDRLPRLTYRRALAVVGLWGLLFILVLTMISGARELMTPGAWARDGATYKLKPTDPDRLDVWRETQTARLSRLEALRIVLADYARRHGGTFPPTDRVPEIPPALWETADPSRARFDYLGAGARLGDAAAPVACEPAALGDPRHVLFGDGQIRKLSADQIRTTLTPARQGGSAP